MADPHGIQLSELAVGNVYLVASPKRVVKVVGHTTAKVRTKRQEALAEIFVDIDRPAIKLVGTIATFPIPNFISEREAKSGQIYRDGVLASSGDLMTPDTVWEEIWTDMAVPGRDTSPGKAAKILEGDPESYFLQVYCASTSRPGKRERVSPIATRPIGELQFIPAKDVPEGLFMTEEELKDAEIRAGNETEPEVLPDNFLKLKSLAKNRGLDISEIPKGEGRVQKIKDFIRKAGIDNAKNSSRESSDTDGRVPVEARV